MVSNHTFFKAKGALRAVAQAHGRPANGKKGYDVNESIRRIAVRKAGQSVCQYRVSAIGLNKRGEVVCSATNRPFLDKPHGSLHAEHAVMLMSNSLKTIVICRLGRAGDVRPIHPCQTCARIANKKGIKIVTIKGDA